jgi:hypothetical protein
LGIAHTTQCTAPEAGICTLAGQWVVGIALVIDIRLSLLATLIQLTALVQLRALILLVVIGVASGRISIVLSEQRHR